MHNAIHVCIFGTKRQSRRYDLHITDGNSARSAYKAYTFKKDDAKLLDGTTEVVYDATNTNFRWDWEGVAS